MEIKSHSIVHSTIYKTMDHEQWTTSNGPRAMDHEQSSIDCHVVPDLDHRHQKNPINEVYYHGCMVRNSEVRWRHPPVVKADILEFQLRTKCHAEMVNYLQTKHIDPNYRWQTFARDHVDGVNDYKCQQWRNGTTYFLRRWGENNFYHSMEDYVTTFVLFATLDIDPIGDDVHIVVVDDKGAGNAFNEPMFTTLFSPNHERMEHAIKSEAMRGPDTMCFRKSVYSIFGAISLFCSEGFRPSKEMLSCRSSILSALSTYTLQRFLNNSLYEIVREKMAGDNASQPKQFRIVYISRGHEINAATKRVLVNEPEMLQFVESKVISSLRTTRVHWTFERVVMEAISIEQQLSVAANADILIGVHGAGLSHTMFLPEREDGMSYLIEIFCGDRDASNTHYRLMAARRGVEYVSMSPRSPGQCALNHNHLHLLSQRLIQAASHIENYRFGEFLNVIEIRERLANDH